MTWVLIVWMIGYNSDVAVTEIRGFKTHPHCDSAGLAIQQNTPRITGTSVRYHCAEVEK